METVWGSVEGQTILNTIESELSLFDSVCNSTHDAAKIWCSTFLITYASITRKRVSIFGRKGRIQKNLTSQNKPFLTMEAEYNGVSIASTCREFILINSQAKL